VRADEIAAEKRRQQVIGLQSFAAQSTRVQNVAHRLMVANRSDCGNNVVPRPGWQLLSLQDLQPASREIFAEALNLDGERLTVATIVEGGPAAKAGLLPGDALVAINGEHIPPTRSSEFVAQHILRDRGPIRVEFLRKGKSHTRSMEPVMGCAVPVLLTAYQGANALTDGRRIVVFSGVLRLAQTDSELAAVLGHELAHITMRHIQKGQQNRAAAVFGGFLGGFATDADAGLKGENAESGMSTRERVRAFEMDFEREADYVGLYFVARADYDVGGGERIWRALAQENPRQIFYAGMHPTTPERVILIQKTAQEIVEKRRRKQPLVPEARAG
jgi:hypothetical protein